MSIPEFTQLDKGKSMIRYLPPKGTAGLATWLVRAYRRLPWPPASSMATHSFFIQSPQTKVCFASKMKPYSHRQYRCLRKSKEVSRPLSWSAWQCFFSPGPFWRALFWPPAFSPRELPFPRESWPCGPAFSGHTSGSGRRGEAGRGPETPQTRRRGPASDLMGPAAVRPAPPKAGSSELSST